MRNRAVSRVVPDPNTRPGPTPASAANRAARWVITSTGFVATMTTASGACFRTAGTTSRNTAAFRRRSWSRVSPGFCPTPAHSTTDPAAGQVGVVAGPHLERVGERDGVPDVVRLGRRPARVLVDEHDLPADAPHDQRRRRPSPRPARCRRRRLSWLLLPDPGRPASSAAIPFCLANSAFVLSSMKKWVFPPCSRVAPAANFGNETLATGSSTISALSNNSPSWICDVQVDEGHDAVVDPLGQPASVRSDRSAC